MKLAAISSDRLCCPSAFNTIRTSITPRKTDTSSCRLQQAIFTMTTAATTLSVSLASSSPTSQVSSSMPTATPTPKPIKPYPDASKESSTNDVNMHFGLLLATHILALALTTICVAARIYVRKVIVKALALDDWVLIATQVSSAEHLIHKIVTNSRADLTRLLCSLYAWLQHQHPDSWTRGRLLADTPGKEPLPGRPIDRAHYS